MKKKARTWKNDCRFFMPWMFTANFAWIECFLYLRGDMGFSSGSMVKNPPVNSGDVGLNPWLVKIPWRRKWQPTLLFLPGKPHGQRRLAGYSPCGSRRMGHNLEIKQQQLSHPRLWGRDREMVPSFRQLLWMSRPWLAISEISPAL